MSSSGCERNWSTFALIHTLLRNRLGYEKLHKLVYVHYNLKLRIQQQELDMQESEIDPIGIMMDAALYDRDNPIMDWLNGSMTHAKPILNEKDDEIFEKEINRQTLNEDTQQDMTNLEKKDLGKHGRKGKRKTIGSDDETQSQPDSPEYDDDDNNDDVTQAAPAKKGETIVKVF
jgi:hypothetical protein